ncbi:pyridoxamine 5'-phosphate oxidase [Dentipellis sp. KUC8613]|nr:pyridoxamine 5'-phosphate oxidase [Dentipellis sp. KUC8613]
MDAMDSYVQEEADKIKVTRHQQYDTSDELSPTTVHPNPLDQFRAWFKSIKDQVHEPEAMTLSTATASGIPSSRTVLFKQLDTRGFVFYTNYESRKSRELSENPNASLVFYWQQVHRQVRVLGKAEKVSREDSEAYYRSRPLGSRIGAWASKQSSVVGEDELHRQFKDVEERFGVHEGDEDKDIPIPDFWGGWRIIPTEIEFWAGKPSRLHDRVRYLRIDGTEESPEWKIERLSP